MTLEDGAYSARGYGGHFIVVIPSRKLVIVHRIVHVNRDVRGRQVNHQEFGRLLALILDAKSKK